LILTGGGATVGVVVDDDPDVPDLSCCIVVILGLVLSSKPNSSFAHKS
jgi:hypothetical protein